MVERDREEQANMVLELHVRYEGMTEFPVIKEASMLVLSEADAVMYL